jgi:hypothetical protein
LNEKWDRLTSTPIKGLEFKDSAPLGSTGRLYMVRTIKLEESASGTYFNSSQGIFTKADPQLKTLELTNLK